MSERVTEEMVEALAKDFARIAEGPDAGWGIYADLIRSHLAARPASGEPVACECDEDGVARSQCITRGCRSTTLPASEPVIAGTLADWSDRAQRAVLYTRAVCKSNGYALAVHGSLRRDIDVVAVPWTAEAVAPDVLAREVLDMLVKVDIGLGWASGGEAGTEKPHGRHAWNIVLAGEPFMYLDLSVIPPTPPAAAQDRERLDWLEARGEDWTCRESGVGRGWRLHQSFSGERDTYVSPRAAIDAAMHAARAAGATDGK